MTHVCASNYFITSDRVLRTDSSMNEIRIFPNGIQTLDLYAGNAGSGSNVLTLDQPEASTNPVLTKVFISGGAGANNVLQVNAANSSEFRSLAQSTTDTQLNSLIVGSNNVDPIQFQSGTLKALYLFGTAHNDMIVNDSSTPSLIDGGGGNDWLVGGSGVNMIFGGGPGNQYLFGTGGEAICCRIALRPAWPIPTTTSRSPTER